MVSAAKGILLAAPLVTPPPAAPPLAAPPLAAPPLAAPPLAVQAAAGRSLATKRYHQMMGTLQAYLADFVRYPDVMPRATAGISVIDDAHVGI